MVGASKQRKGSKEAPVLACGAEEWIMALQGLGTATTFLFGFESSRGPTVEKVTLFLHELGPPILMHFWAEIRC